MELVVPEWMLNRNNANIKKVGLENTGASSLEYARTCLGVDNYSETDILDIGCGVRFTATFINKKIPVKSYTGIELVKSLVDFLKSEVENKDKRFRYVYWNVHNARYNKNGDPMESFDRFPLDGAFDIIWAWSVFTHLSPSDSRNMLRISRHHAKESTKLFFSAFIDDNIRDFDDRDPINTLTYAYYSKDFMTGLVERAGWKVDAFHKPNPAGWVQSVFVCSTK